MLTHHSLTQLKTLRLDGMAAAFEEQITLPGTAALIAQALPFRRPMLECVAAVLSSLHA
jgi:hypothetical protein